MEFTEAERKELKKRIDIVSAANKQTEDFLGFLADQYGIKDIREVKQDLSGFKEEDGNKVKKRILAKKDGHTNPEDSRTKKS